MGSRFRVKVKVRVRVRFIGGRTSYRMLWEGGEEARRRSGGDKVGLWLARNKTTLKHQFDGACVRVPGAEA